MHHASPDAVTEWTGGQSADHSSHYVHFKHLSSEADSVAAPVCIADSSNYLASLRPRRSSPAGQLVPPLRRNIFTFVSSFIFSLFFLRLIFNLFSSKPEHASLVVLDHALERHAFKILIIRSPYHFNHNR